MNRRRTASRRSRKVRSRVSLLAKQADQLWSKLIKRAGACEFQRPGALSDYRPHVCRGALQSMHGIPRTYRATRWEPINGFAGCQAVHWYYTVRKEEWTAFLHWAWGEDVFTELWRQAREMKKPDMTQVVENLKGELGRAS